MKNTETMDQLDKVFGIGQEKHTQGKWEVITWLSDEDDPESINYQVGVKNRPNGAMQHHIVSDCFTGCSSQEEEEANAKLIAAAPKLLSVLQKLSKSVQEHCAISTRPELMELFRVHQESIEIIKEATN